MTRALLIILRWLKAMTRLLPFKWSSKVEGFEDAIAAPVAMLAGKEARDAAEAVREETESDILVMQAKRAEPVERKP